MKEKCKERKKDGEVGYENEKNGGSEARGELTLFLQKRTKFIGGRYCVPLTKCSESRKKERGTPGGGRAGQGREKDPFSRKKGKDTSRRKMQTA